MQIQRKTKARLHQNNAKYNDVIDMRLVWCAK